MICEPRSPYWLFMDRDGELEREYNEGIRLDEILCSLKSGIKTNMDSVVIQKSKDRLLAVLHDFIELPEEELKKKYNVGKYNRDQRIRNLKKIATDAKGCLEKYIVKIMYRVFDERWLFYKGVVPLGMILNDNDGGGINLLLNRVHNDNNCCFVNRHNVDGGALQCDFREHLQSPFVSRCLASQHVIKPNTFFCN